MPSPTFTADFVACVQEFCQKHFAAIARMTRSEAPRRGFTRLAFTEKETATLQYLEKIGRRLNLEIFYDEAQNLHMVLPGKDRNAPAIYCGSHADSVLDGGHFDGLAGIMAALSVIVYCRATNTTPAVDFHMMALRAEEQGLFGSKALLGQLEKVDLERHWPPYPTTLGEYYDRLGIDKERLTSHKPLVDFAKIAVFIELHIEQGLRLIETNEHPTGLVTGIRGLIRHLHIRCVGEDAHSGAIDRPYRHDAAAATVALLYRMEEEWKRRLERGEDLVYTHGVMNTLPTAIFNKIPGELSFSLDIRTLHTETRESFYQMFLDEAKRVEEEYRVQFIFDEPLRLEPQVCSENWIQAFERSAQRIKEQTLRLPSGAGHDAQGFGLEGIPFAMFFVANQNGSHNPDEAMQEDDFLRACAILTHTVLHYE